MNKPVYTKSQIIEALKIGVKWEQSTVQYSIGTGAGTAYYGYTAVNLQKDEMSDFQIESAEKAFRLWDDLIAIDLQRVSAAASDINFDYFTDSGGESAYAEYQYYIPSNILIEASVKIVNPSAQINDQTIREGGRGFYVFLHEIGHTLGLSHPGDYDAAHGPVGDYEAEAEFRQDTHRYTVMSYFDETSANDGSDYGGYHPATPALYDIAVIQDIYGANMNTRTGNTTYGYGNTSGRAAYDFNINKGGVMTIWDAGGRDAINLREDHHDNFLDLRNGHYSSVLGFTNNLAIAFDVDGKAVIEMGKGGSGNDTIRGNIHANKLYGNEGDDTLIGDNGSDYLDGGAGDDNLSGGRGSDMLYGGAGNNHLHGGSGNDRLYAGKDAESFNGWTGVDSLNYKFSDTGIRISRHLGKGFTGYAAGDTFRHIERIYGSLHSDKIYGSANADYLKGSGGSDYLHGYSGNDTLDGGRGHDTLYASRGDNKLIGGSGNDTIYSGMGRERIFGGSGNDAVNYKFSRHGVTVSLETGEGRFGSAEGDVLDSIERLYGSEYGDFLYGSNTVGDSLFGAGGDDLLNGAAGNDRLDGGAGRDRLFGGTGADVFVFSKIGESVGASPDRVEDFQSGIDTLLIASAIATSVSDLNFGSQDGYTDVTDKNSDFRVFVKGTISASDFSFS